MKLTATFLVLAVILAIASVIYTVTIRSIPSFNVGGDLYDSVTSTPLGDAITNPKILLDTSAHQYAKKEWCLASGNDYRIKLIDPVTKKYSYECVYKQAKCLADSNPYFSEIIKDSDPYLTWQDGKCVKATTLAVFKSELCDAGDFPFVDGKLKCDNAGACEMDTPPTCQLTAAYCLSKGMDYENINNGVCSINDVENIFEAIFGKTLIRKYKENALNMAKQCGSGSTNTCAKAIGNYLITAYETGGSTAQQWLSGSKSCKCKPEKCTRIPAIVGSGADPDCSGNFESCDFSNGDGDCNGTTSCEKICDTPGNQKKGVTRTECIETCKKTKNQTCEDKCDQCQQSPQDQCPPTCAGECNSNLRNTCMADCESKNALTPRVCSCDSGAAGIQQKCGGNLEKPINAIGCMSAISQLNPAVFILEFGIEMVDGLLSLLFGTAGLPPNVIQQGLGYAYKYGIIAVGAMIEDGAKAIAALEIGGQMVIDSLEAMGAPMNYVGDSLRATLDVMSEGGKWAIHVISHFGADCLHAMALYGADGAKLLSATIGTFLHPDEFLKNMTMLNVTLHNIVTQTLTSLGTVSLDAFNAFKDVIGSLLPAGVVKDDIVRALTAIEYESAVILSNVAIAFEPWKW